MPRVIVIGMDNSKRLSEWRASKGLSQTSAAQLIGVDQSTLSNWESGKRIPDVRSAFAIDRATEGQVPAAGWVEAPHVA